MVEGGKGIMASSLVVFAAEHAVRVNPLGEQSKLSHFRRVPSCTEGMTNRLSADMILRHEFD